MMCSIKPSTSLCTLKGLIYAQDLVAFNIVQLLHDSAWPANLDLLNHALLSQTEVHSFVARREITAACAHRRVLLAIRCGDSHRSSDRVSIAPVPDQVQR